MSSLFEDEECSLYHDLISDHTDIIVAEIDINKAIRYYPYKNAISKTEFIKLTSEPDNHKKATCLIQHLLKRKQLKELKALFQIVTNADSQHYLFTVLNDRIARWQAAPTKVDSEYANGDQDSESDAGLNSGVRDTKRSQDQTLDSNLNTETEIEERVEKVRSDQDCTLRSRDDENQPDGNLISAQKLIREKTEENDFLIVEQRKLKEEKLKLKEELEEAKTKLEKMQKEISSIEGSNSEVKSQLVTAKGDIRSLRGKLDTRTEEISGMKSEIKHLRGDMDSFDKELKELEPIKQAFNEPKKSRTCSLM